MKLKYFIVLIITIFMVNNLCAITKTFEREYTYRASDVDSKVTSRDNAVNELRKILLREVGEYIKAERRSINGEYSENIQAITAGIVEMKIIDEYWNGNTYWVKARMAVDPAEVNRRIEQTLRDTERSNKNSSTLSYYNKPNSFLNGLYKSPNKAFLLSFLYPRLGHFYVGNESGHIFEGDFLSLTTTQEGWVWTLYAIFGDIVWLGTAIITQDIFPVFVVLLPSHLLKAMFSGMSAVYDAKYHNNKFGYTMLPQIKPISYGKYANGMLYGLSFTINF